MSPVTPYTGIGDRATVSLSSSPGSGALSQEVSQFWGLGAGGGSAWGAPKVLW